MKNPTNAEIVDGITHDLWVRVIEEWHDTGALMDILAMWEEDHAPRDISEVDLGEASLAFAEWLSGIRVDPLIRGRVEKALKAGYPRDHRGEGRTFRFWFLDEMELAMDYGDSEAEAFEFTMDNWAHSLLEEKVREDSRRLMVRIFLQEARRFMPGYLELV